MECKGLVAWQVLVLLGLSQGFAPNSTAGKLGTKLETVQKLTHGLAAVRVALWEVTGRHRENN